jgi:hypothetical protein
MTTRESNVQRVKAVSVDLGIDNIGSGNGKTVKLPLGAELLRLTYHTVTAFNSGTTGTGTVSDGTTTFVNAVDVKSAGSETVSNVPKFYPSGGELTFSLAETGTPATAGRVIATAEYVVNGTGESNYG